MTNTKMNLKPLEETLGNFMDGVFSGLPSFFRNDFNFSEGKGFAPANVKETEKAFVIELAVPGFEKGDFTIRLDQNLLVIEAERKNETKDDNEKQVRREFRFRSFKRTFTIDEKIDTTGIDARYINGVLTLNLPKQETVKPASQVIDIK